MDTMANLSYEVCGQVTDFKAVLKIEPCKITLIGVI